MGWFKDVRDTLARIETNTDQVATATAQAATVLEDIYTLLDQEQQDIARRDAQPLN